MKDYNAYNDPILINLHKDSNTGNPVSVEITNEAHKVFKSAFVLNEIPDKFHKVIIDGYEEVEKYIQTPTQFRVDYQHGIVFLHMSVENGVQINVRKYYGIGMFFIPDSRIYLTNLNSSSEIVESLYDYINSVRSYKHKGKYLETVNYDINNIVLYNGSTYICQKECVNISPINEQYWTVLASGFLIKGEFTLTDHYNERDIVLVDNEKMFVCIKKCSNISPENLEYWLCLFDLSALKQTLNEMMQSANNKISELATEITNYQTVIKPDILQIKQEVIDANELAHASVEIANGKITELSNRINNYDNVLKPAIENATNNANNKAGLADEKANLADQKANLANEKAMLADTKITELTSKINEYDTVLKPDIVLATNNANDKAGLADTKANLADQKANLANEKAMLADTKITELTSKISEYDTVLKPDIVLATNNANDKASLADVKANLADQKANLANEKAILADGKITELTSKITNYDTVLKPNIENATDNANEKAALANTKAELADQAKNNAITATTNCNNVISDYNTKIALSIMILKEPVQSFSDISTTYPTPENGWMVKVLDADKFYRFDGINANDWIWIDSSSNPDIAFLEAKIGNLNELVTIDKSNIVHSINEIDEKINSEIIGIHTHDNKNILDLLSDINGILQYDGKPIETEVDGGTF